MQPCAMWQQCLASRDGNFCITKLKRKVICKTQITFFGKSILYFFFFFSLFREFGDIHNTAVDETWYKAAVLQHETDPESFVYLIPHDAIPDDEDGLLRVSASYAIFPKQGDLEAPGCVVGFKFNHDLMVERFRNITTKDKVQFNRFIN